MWQIGVNMVLKIAIPGKMQFKMMRREPYLLHRKGDVHYIGGAEVLPPPLPSEQENQVIGDLGTEYEDEAKAILIEHNLRLVVYIAKKFDNTGVGVEDLISIGTIGLIKGVNTYRDDRGVRLATYASRCIENVNITQWRKTGKPVLAACLERREEKRRVFCTLGDGAFLMTKTFLQRIFAALFICSFPLRCGRRRRGVRNTGTAALAQSEKPRCAV